MKLPRHAPANKRKQCRQVSDEVLDSTRQSEASYSTLITMSLSIKYVRSFFFFCLSRLRRRSETTAVCSCIIGRHPPHYSAVCSGQLCLALPFFSFLSQISLTASWPDCNLLESCTPPTDSLSLRVRAVVEQTKRQFLAYAPLSRNKKHEPRPPRERGSTRKRRQL